MAGSVVLVTGYPSFGVRQLVSHLLAEEPDTQVRAVVRASLAPAAQAHRASLDPALAARLTLLDGDAAHLDLGLRGREVRDLSAEVDRFHHAAQVSYLGAEPREAEALNVGGTREALAIARALPRLRAFVHHGTAFVSGDRTGLVREDELRRGQRFRNAVEETKARAEKLVRDASAHLPTVILRPSLVVGDSATGEVDRLDGPYLLVLLLLSSPVELAIPLPGRGRAPLHIVPVDYVVRAARLLGLHPDAVGKTFHLVDRAPLTAREVFELVARAGGKRGPRGFIPANVTRALLHTPGLDRFVKSPRAFFDQLVTEVQYDTRATDAVLGHAVSCPPFASYVDPLVTYVRARVEEERERRRAEGPDDVEDSLT